jgi:hypothetical protein
MSNKLSKSETALYIFHLSIHIFVTSIATVNTYSSFIATCSGHSVQPVEGTLTTGHVEHCTTYRRQNTQCPPSELIQTLHDSLKICIYLFIYLHHVLTLQLICSRRATHSLPNTKVCFNNRHCICAMKFPEDGNCQ